MSHVMATCLCYFPSLGLFFSLPLRQLHQLMGFAYRQFQETTICLLLNVINTEYVYTHTHKCSSSSSASATGTVGGGPNVLVMLIPSYAKNISENIEDQLCALLCLGSFATCTERELEVFLLALYFLFQQF